MSEHKESTIVSQIVRMDEVANFLVSFHYVLEEFGTKRWRGHGNLISLLHSPVRTNATNDSTRIYSMLIHGLGNPSWNEWAMQRAEWLALEVIILVKQLLEQNPRLVDAAMGANGQDVQLYIAWAPHKMQFDGFDMSSSAPGSNHRADFMLARSVGQPRKLIRICRVYHTTNVPKETTSNDPSIVNPESRLLAQCDFPLHDVVDEAVQEAAASLRGRLGLQKRHLPAPPAAMPTLRDGDSSSSESSNSGEPEDDDRLSVDTDDS